MYNQCEVVEIITPGIKETIIIYVAESEETESIEYQLLSWCKGHNILTGYECLNESGHFTKSMTIGAKLGPMSIFTIVSPPPDEAPK